LKQNDALRYTDINELIVSDGMKEICIEDQPRIAGELRPLLHLERLSLLATGITSLNTHNGCFRTLESLILKNNPHLRNGRPFINDLVQEDPPPSALRRIEIERCPLFFDNTFHEVLFGNLPFLNTVLLINNNFQSSRWNVSLVTVPKTTLKMVNNHLSSEDDHFFRMILPDAIDGIENLDLKEHVEQALFYTFYDYIKKYNGLPVHHSALIDQVLECFDEIPGDISNEVKIRRIYDKLITSQDPLLGGKIKKTIKKRHNSKKCKTNKTNKKIQN
jgi:hypothetical protein